MESRMVQKAETLINAAKYKQEKNKCASERNAEKVKRSQSTLNVLEKENNQNMLCFEMKNIESLLKSLNEEESRIIRDNLACDEIEFVRNEKILDQLKIEENFGSISACIKPSEDGIVCINYERALSMGFPSDNCPCEVTGMVLTSATQMIVTDYGNKTINRIDVKTGNLILAKTLSSAPIDVIKIPENKLAVVLPNEQCIQIMSYSDTSLSLDRRLMVGEMCFCGAYCQGKLIVGCSFNPGKLVILDLAGNITQVFGTPGLFGGPKKIVISSDQRFMYVSDGKEKGNCLKVDWHGNVLQRFQNQEFKNPQGIQELEDGTILVCCRDSHNVVRLSSSFKNCDIVGLEKTNFHYPQNVAYDDSGSKLYISCSSVKESSNNDTIKEFNVRFM